MSETTDDFKEKGVALSTLILLIALPAKMLTGD